MVISLQTKRQIQDTTHRRASAQARESLLLGSLRPPAYYRGTCGGPLMFLLRHPAKTGVVLRSLITHRGLGPARLTVRPGQASHGSYSSKAISKLVAQCICTLLMPIFLSLLTAHCSVHLDHCSCACLFFNPFAAGGD